MSALLHRLATLAAIRRLRWLSRRLRAQPAATAGTLGASALEPSGQVDDILGAAGADWPDLSEQIDEMSARLEAIGERIEAQWGEVDERLQRVGREQVR